MEIEQTNRDRDWRRGFRRAGGFTLIEIMLVMALMGVVMTIGLPSMFRAMKKSPMRQAVSDLQEACRTARTMAILQGTPAEVVVNATDGGISVRPVADVREQDSGAQAAAAEAEAARREAELSDAPAATPVPTFSARLPDSIAFKKLLVNLRDQMDNEDARVRFYPNGTCDAFTATLFSEENEERVISLEITTGRDDMEIIR